MPAAVVYKTIREQIAEHIRTDVLSGEFAAGERLREQSLATKYGVSRGPVRDALLQLTQEGVLVAKPNCGVAVNEPLTAALQPLVVDLRLHIETFAVTRAIAGAREALVGQLEDLVCDLEAACRAEDIPGGVQADMAFHRAVIEAAEEPELLAIWLPIVARMMLHYTRHESLMDSCREHEAILAAVRAGDVNSAVDALGRNIR